MKRKFLLLVAALSVLLQGCAATKPDQGTAVDITGVSIDVVTTFAKTDGYHDIYTRLVESFQDETNAVVNDASGISDEAWKQAVIRSFDTGEEPDVLFFFYGSGAESFIRDGKVVDIETIRSYRPSYAMNINLGVMDSLRAKDGQNYCVPVSGFWEGLFINEDLFEQYGVAVPTSMDELYTAVDAFHKASITPIAADIARIPHYWFEYLVLNHTGPSQHLYTVPDNPDALPESWVEGLEMFRTLYNKKAFPENPEGMTEEICIEMFNNKEAAMLLNGSWKTGAITDPQNVRIVPVPASDPHIRKHTDIIGGFSMGFYITQKAWGSAEKREAAVRFIETMTNENGLTLFNAGGAASPGPVKEPDNASPLVASGRAYVSGATAYVPAVQDGFSTNAREYLFAEILEIARGNTDARDALKHFIELNKGH